MLVQRGQKADVTKGKQIDRLTVRLGFRSASPDMEIDGAAFLLGENGTCGQDEDFIFTDSISAETEQWSTLQEAEGVRKK